LVNPICALDSAPSVKKANLQRLSARTTFLRITFYPVFSTPRDVGCDHIQTLNYRVDQAMANTMPSRWKPLALGPWAYTRSR